VYVSSQSVCRTSCTFLSFFLCFAPPRDVAKLFAISSEPLIGPRSRFPSSFPRPRLLEVKKEVRLDRGKSWRCGHLLCPVWRLPCRVGHLHCLVGHLRCRVRRLRCRVGRVRRRCLARAETLLRGFLQLTSLQSWSLLPLGPPTHSMSSPRWTQKCLCLSEVR
jgi:hypothetical protein